MEWNCCTAFFRQRLLTYNTCCLARTSLAPRFFPGRNSEKKVRGEKKQENTLRRSLLRSFFLRQMLHSRVSKFLSFLVSWKDLRRSASFGVWTKALFQNRLFVNCFGSKPGLQFEKEDDAFILRRNIVYLLALCLWSLPSVVFFEAGKEWNALDQLELVNVGVGGGRKIHHGREGFFFVLVFGICVCILFLLQGLLQKKTKKGLLLGLYLLVSFLNGFFYE